MEASVPALPLDVDTIKKAAHALLAYSKTRQKTAEKLLLNEDSNVFLMVTVWKIPPREQVVKITLPHGILPATSEVCLFTKDEPGLTAEQTENLYRKLLSQNGITNIAEVISYKTLAKEYKSFEAKRRLLNRFSLFLSDDRIRRLLPSHIGKHFYRRKKAPLSVNLKAKNLPKEINRVIQGTILPVTNKGCCYTARVGHTGMTAEEIAENVATLGKELATKAPKISQSIKVLHLKTDKSVALPIFNWAYPGSEGVQKQTAAKGQKKKEEKKKNQKKKRNRLTPGQPKELAEGSDSPAPGSLKREEEGMNKISDVVDPELEDDEAVPVLVPIGMETCGSKNKVALPSPSAKKEAEMEPKGPLLGKRKLSLSSKAAVTGLKTPSGGSKLKTPKQLKQSKKAKTPEKEDQEEELAKKTMKPKRKSSANHKKENAVMTAKKSPRTPKQAIRKRDLLHSV